MAKCCLAAKWATWNFLNLWLFFKKTEASTSADSKNKAGDHIVASKEAPKTDPKLFFSSLGTSFPPLDFIGILSDKQFGTGSPIQPFSRSQQGIPNFTISSTTKKMVLSLHLLKDETIQPKRSNKIEHPKNPDPSYGNTRPS